MLESLTADDFRPYIGDAYRLVPVADEPLDAVLITVTEHERRPIDTRTPFSLLFRAPVGTSLGQATFRVEHPDRGVVELFMVPVGPDPDPEADGMLYEAVFG